MPTERVFITTCTRCQAGASQKGEAYDATALPEGWRWIDLGALGAKSKPIDICDRCAKSLDDWLESK